MRRFSLFISVAVGVCLLACAPLTATGIALTATGIGRSDSPTMNARADAIAMHASGTTDTMLPVGTRADSGHASVTVVAREADRRTVAPITEDVIPLTAAVLPAVVLVAAIIGFAGLVGHHH